MRAHAQRAILAHQPAELGDGARLGVHGRFGELAHRGEPRRRPPESAQPGRARALPQPRAQHGGSNFPQRARGTLGIRIPTDRDRTQPAQLDARVVRAAECAPHTGGGAKTKPTCGVRSNGQSDGSRCPRGKSCQPACGAADHKGGGAAGAGDVPSRMLESARRRSAWRAFQRALSRPEPRAMLVPRVAGDGTGFGSGGGSGVGTPPFAVLERSIRGVSSACCTPKAAMRATTHRARRRFARSPRPRRAF